MVDAVEEEKRGYVVDTGGDRGESISLWGIIMGKKNRNE